MGNCGSRVRKNLLKYPHPTSICFPTLQKQNKNQTKLRIVERAARTRMEKHNRKKARKKKRYISLSVIILACQQYNLPPNPRYPKVRSIVSSPASNSSLRTALSVTVSSMRLMGRMCKSTIFCT